MKQRLFTLAIGHLNGPAAEIFTSERGALVRRLELAEVTNEQRAQLMQLFDSGDTAAYQRALDQLESKVSLVCSIEEHRIGDHCAGRRSGVKHS